jgi:4,5-dihydroxyphthalate decarboxylase
VTGSVIRGPWSALLGDYPSTHALRTGAVQSPAITLDFADVAVPNRAFKRVVRDVDFDVAELALMTYLMARSRGVPLVLLPVALFSRNPLARIVCRGGAHRIGPRDLEGRRVGVRAYTTTTALWARALLADEFGVRSRRIQWYTCEDGHVAGVFDPAHVQRTSGPTDLIQRLRTGALDAAIVEPVPTSPDVAPVVADAGGVWRRWRAHTGAQTINHVVVVRESIAADTAAMRELLGLFRASRDRADSRADRDAGSIGFDVMRRTLDVAIAVATAEGLLARPLTPDDLTTVFLRSL